MFRHGDPGGDMYAVAGTSGANIGMNWTSITSPLVMSVVAGAGRTGGHCLRWTSNCVLQKTMDAQATWGTAFALRVGAAPNAPIVVWSIDDGGTTQDDLRLNSDLTLSITRNGTVLGTSSTPISAGNWSHLEIKILIGTTSSNGTAELRINGVTKIGPLSSINTKNTSNSSANAVFIGPSSVSGNPSSANPWDICDIIIWDGQATDANGNDDIHDFIGDCSLTWLLPSGAGTTTQWTPDSGSNYARVNESTPDGDTSYVASSTVGQIDTYAMSDLAVSGLTVKSIMTVINARKDDSGSRTVQTELRTNGADFAHPTVISLSNSYLYYQQNWGMNPSGTPATWTEADINAIEAGQIVNS